MAFINIETKEDTAAKIAAVSGKPTKNYLFAAEINIVRNRIETLWNAIKGTAVIVNRNKVSLGTIAQPFITILNQGETLAWDSPVFVTYDVAGTFYTQAFVGTNGDYGTTSNQFVDTDFLLVEQSQTPPSNSYYLRGILNDYNGVTIDILENTFPGTFNFVKESDGEYSLTLSTNLTPNTAKFQIFIGAPAYEEDGLGKFSCVASSGNYLTITSKNATTNVPTSAYMTGVPILIYYK
ncbi:hypothetical protein [Flavobacterium sp.]